MRFLLLNDNPVVNKLVTLSAQKTGDDLVVSKSVDDIEGNKYDLLIIDHAFYTNSLLDILEDKLSYRRSLFIAHRGEEVPEGFDKVIHKPFLPTDLVEYFSTQIPQEDETPMDDEQSEVAFIEEDAEETLEELDLDLDLDLLNALPEIDDEGIEGLDLDDTDEGMLLSDLDDLDLGGIEGFDEVEGGVLDEDELLEVQGLLEEDVPAIEKSIEEDDQSLGLTSASMDEVNDALDDLDGADLRESGVDESDMEGLLLEDELLTTEDALMEGLELLSDEEVVSDDEEMLLTDDLETMSSDDGDLEASLSTELEEDLGQLIVDESDTASDEMADDVMDDVETMLLDEEPLTIEDEMDLGDLDDELELPDVEEGTPEPEMVSDGPEQASHLDVSMDDLEMLDDETVSVSKKAEDAGRLDEDDLDEALDMDAEVDIDVDDMEILEEELESAVSALSEEELAQDIDEAILHDMFEESTELPSESVVFSEGFDELDSLNEHDLKVALGEAEDDGDASVLEPDDLSTLLDGDETQMTVAASDEGVEALHELTKTLRKVLKDDSSAAALQGMKINVNITFGEAR